MSWAEPLWFMGLFAVVGLAAVLVLAARRHHVALARTFRGEVLERVLPAAVRRRRVLRDASALLGLALCFVALAEPRTDKELQTIDVRGTDLVLALDLSRSMDAADVDPSRLERARREVGDLLANLEGDRIGLVVFAGGAVPRLPLTLDYRAMMTVLAELRTDDFHAQGSDMGGAIRASMKLLSRDDTPAGKAIVLVSDGEVFDPADAIAAAKEAAEAKIPIYTIGVGAAASPIPLEGGGFFEWQGEQIITTPDTSSLEELARLTGGAYVQSVASADDMTGLVGELRRSLTAVVRQQQQRETWKSAFQLPLGLGAFLLFFAAWLGDGRRLVALAALLFGLGLTVRAEAADLVEADRAYRAGDYARAARALEELSLEAPGDPALLERLAAARYRAADYEGAAQAWERASDLRGGDVSDQYSAGNANYQAGRLERARELYDQVLAAQPDDARAAQNKQMVEKELAERRKPKPPPPPKGGGSQENATPKPGSQDPSQGNEGPPQPGEGDPQPGDPGDPQQGDPQPGDPQPGGGSKSDQPPQGQGGPAPGEGDPTQGDPAAGGQGTAPSGEAGEYSAAQADRLLDSIEEAQPGYSYGGPPGGKPW